MSEGSKVPAERFLRRYLNPNRRGVPDPIVSPPRKKRHEDPHLLRELIVEQLGRGVVSPMEIYQRVVDDYGSLHIRRFWRVMRYLVDEGILERMPEGYRSVRAGRRA